ncbi:hypothetical protein ASD39_19205 [Sphingomonas sp. Root50]|nr:hypothetical protein ASD17_15770 [Sphingomonas sp. Root1294]KQY72079.1 hypothetical protein ASD39_19205 [Sphingomonas sp. Root50]KRB94652.1 hypothetical protein ASE22_01550 [Sphingomonas sp. Root720]
MAGPHCGLIFAEHGADVIKVEPPAGDWLRRLGRSHDDLSAHFLAFNRGKRSLSLDLRDDAGREAALALAAQADILIENNRPGVSDRLGLGYAQVSAVNPGIIYVSVTGFSQTGPYRDLPGTDGVIQAYTGIIDANRPPEGPGHKLSYVAVDFTAGLYAYQAAITALYARPVHGGTHLDISLTGSIAALMSAKYIEAVLDGEAARRDMSCPCGTFETKDGLLYMVVMSDAQWPKLLAAMDLTEVLGDPRYAALPDRHRQSDVIDPILKARFAEISTAEWCERLSAADLLHYPVRTYLDFLDDEHVRQTNMFTWASQDGVGRFPVAHLPGTPPREAHDSLLRAPHLNEHAALVMPGGAWPRPGPSDQPKDIERQREAI